MRTESRPFQQGSGSALWCAESFHVYFKNNFMYFFWKSRHFIQQLLCEVAGALLWAGQHLIRFAKLAFQKWKTERDRKEPTTAVLSEEGGGSDSLTAPTLPQTARLQPFTTEPVKKRPIPLRKVEMCYSCCLEEKTLLDEALKRNKVLMWYLLYISMALHHVAAGQPWHESGRWQLSCCASLNMLHILCVVKYVKMLDKHS